jgi:hypothetical protein
MLMLPDSDYYQNHHCHHHFCLNCECACELLIYIISAFGTDSP